MKSMMSALENYGAYVILCLFFWCWRGDTIFSSQRAATPTPVPGPLPPSTAWRWETASMQHLAWSMPRHLSLSRGVGQTFSQSVGRYQQGWWS